MLPVVRPPFTSIHVLLTPSELAGCLEGDAEEADYTMAEGIASEVKTKLEELRLEFVKESASKLFRSNTKLAVAFTASLCSVIVGGGAVLAEDKKLSHAHKKTAKALTPLLQSTSKACRNTGDITAQSELLSIIRGLRQPNLRSICPCCDPTDRSCKAPKEQVNSC